MTGGEDGFDLITSVVPAVAQYSTDTPINLSYHVMSFGNYANEF